MRLCAVAQLGEREVRARRERVVAQSSGLPARAVSGYAVDDRRQLRDQIIGRRDSFGKLYAVTRELDEVQPQKLYHTAIRIMQESLDSDSLAIFRVDNGGQFARLVAASPRFDVGSFRSVRVSDYGEIITALEHNGI